MQSIFFSVITLLNSGTNKWTGERRMLKKKSAWSRTQVPSPSDCVLRENNVFFSKEKQALRIALQLIVIMKEKIVN